MFSIGDKVLYTGFANELTATIISLVGSDGDRDLLLINFDDPSRGWSGSYLGLFYHNLWWSRRSAKNVILIGPTEPELD